MPREARHLREIAERALAGIELPVRVGDEADRGVESQVGREIREVLRVERKPLLREQHEIEPREADELERKERERIRRPAHLARIVDAANRIGCTLHWFEQRIKEGALAFEDAVEIDPKRLHADEYGNE